MSEKKQTALSNSRFCIKEFYQNDGRKRLAKLRISWFANNPQLTVNLGLNKEATRENNFGNISVSLSNVEVSCYFEMLTEALSMNPGEGISIPYYLPAKERGEPETLTHRILVGKDEEGYVYTSLLEMKESTPKVKFVFRLDERLKKCTHRDKTPLSPALETKFAVNGFIRAYTGVLASMAVQHYEPSTQNGNWKDKNKNNSRQAPADTDISDDDIPF